MWLIKFYTSNPVLHKKIQSVHRFIVLCCIPGLGVVRAAEFFLVFGLAVPAKFLACLAL